MTSAMEKRTVMPPAHRQELVDALAALTQDREHRAVLVAPDGARISLPDEVFEILRDVLRALSEGLAITIARSPRRVPSRSARSVA